MAQTRIDNLENQADHDPNLKWPFKANGTVRIIF